MKHSRKSLEQYPRLRPWCPGEAEVGALIAGAIIAVLAVVLPVAASLVTWP